LCEKVASEPRVKCMADEGRLNFYCPEIVGSTDGLTRIELKDVGKIPEGTPRYVNFYGLLWKLEPSAKAWNEFSFPCQPRAKFR